ncbi:MAG: AraC family transcriptional regulator [Gemmiger sp.]|nr:AraC family transcriptional regulator [Gemmiger sp.]
MALATLGNPAPGSAGEPVFTKSNTIREESSQYFNTPSSFARENLLYVEMYGRFACAETYRVERDGFDSYLLMLTTEGSGTVETAAGAVSCGKNTVTLVDCNAWHRYYANGHWRFYWLHINGRAAGPLMGQLLRRQGAVVPVAPTTPAMAAFCRLATQGPGHTIEQEITASAQLHGMMAALLTATHGADAATTQLTTQVLAYLDAHYQEPFGVEALARRLGVSTSTLSHTFKQETGFSPYDFFINRRMNQAKYLLKATQNAVAEIAEAVGYQSTANFITQFRRRYGQTPGAFRTNSQHDA